MQSAVYEAVDADSQSESQARAMEVLTLIKEIQPSEFNQSTIYLLKCLTSDPILKQKVLAVLSGKPTGSEQQSNLISTFGDQEYSILNALSSAHV